MEDNAAGEVPCQLDRIGGLCNFVFHAQTEAARQPRFAQPVTISTITGSTTRVRGVHKHKPAPSACPRTDAQTLNPAA